MIIDVNKENFTEVVLESDKPVLLDFWAVWCMPCRMMNPHIKALATEFEGKVVVAKIDVDASPEFPEKYGVQGIPTIVIVVNGKEVTRARGNVGPRKLREMVTAWI